MNAYSVELRSVETKRVIASQQISADAGSVQRRNLAERLCRRYSDPRDCYVVEYEHDTASPVAEKSVINKYSL